MDQANKDDGSCATSRIITKEGIVLLDRQIQLSNGTRCQVLSSQPLPSPATEARNNYNNNNNSSQPQVPFRPSSPPLLFLHGTFHGAWCWQEHFFPYFVSLGHTVIAISWRGTSRTHSKDDLEDFGATHTQAGWRKFNKKKKIKISDHVEDLECVMEKLPEIVLDGLDKRGPEDRAANKERNRGNQSITDNQDTNNKIKPILICHSFGGIIAMKYFETLYERDRNMKRPSDIVSGIVSLCSVPPSGLNPMIFRSMWKSFGHTWKVIKGIPMKQATTDPILCRYLFFDHDSTGKERRMSQSSGGNERDGSNDFRISDVDIARYQEHFRQDSKSVIDVGHLAKNVPSKKVNNKGQSATFVSDDDIHVKPPPILVVSARDDKIVDLEGNIETALYYGLGEEDVKTVDSPHDVMLVKNWRETADVIQLWLEQHNFEN